MTEYANPVAEGPQRHRLPKAQSGPRRAIAASLRGHDRLEQEAGPSPMVVRFDPVRPWVCTVGGAAGAEEVARAVYGIADSSLVAPDADLHPAPSAGYRYVVIPDLLLPDVRQQFDTAMRVRLDGDVERIKAVLLRRFVTDEDRTLLLESVGRWAQCADVLVSAGTTYFDTFLGRLHSDKWVTDYGLWKSKPSTFLDAMYSALEPDVSPLIALIAARSVRFGAYRPPWLALRAADGRPGTAQPIDQGFVERVTNEVLNRLEDATSEADSKEIADILVSLPPVAQRAVLQNVTRRFDEAGLAGVFGRFGEASGGGMLYYLFEDLTEADRARLAESLRRNGVLTSQAIDALVAGRGWGGKYLPYTTHKATEAAQFWADANVAGATKGGAGGTAQRVGAGTMGGFASLWLPHTAGQTVTVLGTAAAGQGLSAAFPTTMGVVGAAGTGYSAYQGTILVQELATGRDVWTGRPLADEEKLSRGLLLGATIITIGTTAYAVRGWTITRVATPPRALLEDGFVKLDVNGMPPGQELWVPRHSAAARAPGAAAWDSFPTRVEQMSTGGPLVPRGMADVQAGTPSFATWLALNHPGTTVTAVEPGTWRLAYPGETSGQGITTVNRRDLEFALRLSRELPQWPGPGQTNPPPSTTSPSNSRVTVVPKELFPARGADGRLIPQRQPGQRTPQEDIVGLEFTSHPEFWGTQDAIYLRRPFALRAALGPALMRGAPMEGPPAAVAMGQELNRWLRPGGFVEFRLLRPGDREVVYLIRQQIPNAQMTEVPATAIKHFETHGAPPPNATAEQAEILRNAAPDIRGQFGGLGEGRYQRIIRITKPR
jgi:hypothetical protein